MRRTVSATEARVHFGDLLRRVGEGGETIFVKKGGLLQAVVLPASEYDRLLAGQEPEAWRERARLARERIRAEVTGATLPPAEEVVQAGREERDEHLSSLR